MKVNGVEFEEAVWTTDCQGKQDLDFPVLQVKTRYWPDHTATPAIFMGEEIICELDPEDYIRGESEIECKKKTEEWIQSKLLLILGKLEGVFD